MAKQGLNKIWIFKDQIGLKLGEPVEREMEEQRREEEEKKKKKERSSSKAPLRYGTWIFGMETHLDHEFYVIMYEFPCYWMVVSYP